MPVGLQEPWGRGSFWGFKYVCVGGCWLPQGGNVGLGGGRSQALIAESGQGQGRARKSQREEAGRREPLSPIPDLICCALGQGHSPCSLPSVTHQPLSPLQRRAQARTWPTWETGCGTGSSSCTRTRSRTAQRAAAGPARPWVRQPGQAVRGAGGRWPAGAPPGARSPGQGASENQRDVGWRVGSPLPARKELEACEQEGERSSFSGRLTSRAQPFGGWGGALLACWWGHT